MKMGGGSKMQTVAAAWIIAVAAVTSVCYAQESQADCLKRCMGGCGGNQQFAGMCSMNCAISCHWPFSQPTGEVMVTQGAGENGADDAAAVQAVFSTHPNAGAAEPAAANHQATHAQRN